MGEEWVPEQPLEGCLLGKMLPTLGSECSESLALRVVGGSVSSVGLSSPESLQFGSCSFFVLLDTDEKELISVEVVTFGEFSTELGHSFCFPVSG
jgi:hypothetical protein